jgi:hypothetical protein
MIEEIGTHAGITLLIHLLDKVRRVRFLRYKMIERTSEIRVSFSALLCIHQGGKYLLVQNLHRAEAYGPFGGVYKYCNDGSEYLDKIGFRREDLGPGIDMRDDLRGYISGANLSELVKWFSQNQGREVASECLRRELKEELKEINISSIISTPNIVHVKLIRKVEEGPERILGLPYKQYRVFEIWEPTDTNFDNICKKLFNSGKNNKKLLIANTHEILRGRASDGRVIGHHTAYLIGRKRTLPEERPLVQHTTQSG